VYSTERVHQKILQITDPVKAGRQNGETYKRAGRQKPSQRGRKQCRKSRCTYAEKTKIKTQAVYRGMEKKRKRKKRPRQQ